MDLAKRRKVETFLDVVARSALDASVSVSAVISALVGNLGLPRETAKRLERKAAALLVQLPDTDTPFGKLCQISTVFPVSLRLRSASTLVSRQDSPST